MMKTEKAIKRVAVVLITIMAMLTGLFATMTESYAASLPKTSITSLSRTSNNTLQVKWKKVPGAVKYKVYRLKSGGKWTHVRTTTGTTYKSPALTYHKKYYFKVKAVNKYGSGYYSTTKSIYTKYKHTTRITSVKRLNYNYAQISWKRTSGAVKYKVYRLKSGGKWYLAKTTTSTTYKSPALSYNKKYYFKVKAVDRYGRGDYCSYKSMVTGYKYPTRITISGASSRSLYEKQYVKLTASTPSAKYRKVTWSSSNPKIAKVSSTGTVTAVSAGTARIYAKVSGGKSDSVLFTVTPNYPSTVTITKTVKDNNLFLKANIRKCRYNQITWSSSDENIATVDRNGVVTAVSAGTATITATTVNNLKATTTATVTKVKQKTWYLPRYEKAAGWWVKYTESPTSKEVKLFATYNEQDMDDFMEYCTQSDYFGPQWVDSGNLWAMKPTGQYYEYVLNENGSYHIIGDPVSTCRLHEIIGGEVQLRGLDGFNESEIDLGTRSYIKTDFTTSDGKKVEGIWQNDMIKFDGWGDNIANASAADKARYERLKTDTTYQGNPFFPKFIEDENGLMIK